MTLLRFSRYCLLILSAVYLSGCMKPQIIQPMSSGFSPNEYLVVEEISKSHLGQLYQAVQELDKNGKNLPLRWGEIPILIYPQGRNVNLIEDSTIEQTRNVVETSDMSGKLTAAAIVSLDGKRSTAFKYQSKASKFYQLKLPLKYNPDARDYIIKKLKNNPAYRFGYLAALYEGTAFVEVLNSVDTSGSGNYAAFQLEDKYYTTTNTGIINSGPIIYRILPVDVDQLVVAVVPDENKIAPLSHRQLEAIIINSPASIRQMIKLE
jgi:hypothetical protein